VSYLCIALGAGLGGVLRYAVSGVAVRLGAVSFPYGTLFINVAGSAFIGFFATLTGADGRVLVAPNTRLFVMTGICGGFTTFSTFSLETLRLLQDRQYAAAASNITASIALCLLGVWAGHQLALYWNQR